MGTAICQDGDLDFRLIFGEEDSDSPSPRSTLHTADLESDDPSLCNDVTTDTLTLNLSNTCVTGGAGSGMGCARAGMHSPPPRRSSDHDINGTFLSQPSRFIPLGGSRFLECPSIRITSDSPSNSDGEQEEQGRRDIWDERPHRDQLFLPPDPFVYRDSFLSPSPASSHSSWSILSSEASSCDSLGQMCEEVERELNEAASRFTLASPLGSPRGSPKPWSVHNDEFWPSDPSGPPASSREELLSPYPQGQISRPTSPCGKRRYSNSNEDSIHHTSSPSPSPSRRGSLGDENLSSEAEASPKPPEHNQQTISNSQERGDNIPQKARRTSAEQTVAPVRPEESSSPAKTFSSGASVCLSDENNVMFPQTRKENAGMDYLAVPSALAWSKARVGGQSPVFRSSSLPPLDWPLPCQYEGLELRIEVQPRTHHRAHYETEGSRGAVKASPGGHPIVKRRDAAERICHGVLGQTEEKRKEKIYMTEDVTRGYNEKPLTLQMFIGTADERNLRPHAFYQVHRITGKMVATPSYEALVGSTKVLEMSLLPENNMCANIDCAGILKLRNSDIELRKGETDIGRKNTRVRLVFRVHIPQGGGKGISLQVASIPIECSQRSAQELPQVENYSLSACSVNGREELLLCGSNFLSDSKVVFIEKGPANTLSGCEKAHVVHLDPFVFTMSGITGVTLSLSSLLLLDGKLQWEEEAKVNRLKSNESLLSVQVPEYCNKEITRPLQVYFYISNGRRKRSPMQSFRYLPIIFKEEQLPEMTLHRFPPSSLPPPSHIILDPGHMELSTSFESSVTSNLSEAPMEVSPYYISPHQERMFSGASDCSAGNSSFLGCYFNPTVLSELKCPPSYPENGGDMSITLPFQTSNSALPPSPVPWSPQPRSSQPTSSNTFSGSLHPHLNTNNKLEERGTGSHANYQSSPILPSLEFDSTPHFGPGYEPYPSCPPPTYTTLGEVNRLDTMHSKQSTTSPEMSRTEQSTSNQQFTQSTLSNHSTNPVHALRSKIDEVGTVSHTGFSTTNSSLSLSCKDNGGSQTFSTDYHNMSSCSPSQLTTLCPSTHPATFSSSPSPTIPSTPDPGHEATSDTTVCIPSNRNQKDVCYQEHLEEYTKSANSGGGEVRKEHSQVFENPFHPIPIQGITLEEVSEFIGQDLHSFPERHQN